jgi:prephenate dehydratase
VLVPQDVAQPVADANKASLHFHTDHSRGSLARVLSRIADAGINLSKLQSSPIPGTDFQYSFYADMEFDTPDQLNAVIDSIKPVTKELRIYGVYKNGKSTE